MRRVPGASTAISSLHGFRGGCRVAVYGTFGRRERLKRDHGWLESVPDAATRYPPTHTSLLCTTLQKFKIGEINVLKMTWTLH